MDLAALPRELCLEILARLDRMTMLACGVPPGRLAVPGCLKRGLILPRRYAGLTRVDLGPYLLYYHDCGSYECDVKRDFGETWGSLDRTRWVRIG